MNHPLGLLFLLVFTISCSVDSAQPDNRATKAAEMQNADQDAKKSKNKVADSKAKGKDADKSEGATTDGNVETEAEIETEAEGSDVPKAAPTKSGSKSVFVDVTKKAGEATGEKEAGGVSTLAAEANAGDATAANEFLQNTGAAVDTFSLSLTQIEERLVLLDPTTAKVVLDGSLTLGRHSEAGEFRVPEIKMRFVGADFIKMLRCVKSYAFVGPTGENLFAKTGAKMNVEHMRWGWTQARNDNRQCKVIGDGITRVIYQDLTAQTGEFYYVINPCVSDVKSKTGTEGCSFNLVRTEEIKYENTSKAEFTKKAEELSKHEAVLSAHHNNAVRLAREIYYKFIECEENRIYDEVNRRHARGWAAVGAMAVGSLIPGGGPIVGQMLGGMAIQAFDQWKKPGIMDPNDPNYCPTIQPMVQEYTDILDRKITEALQRVLDTTNEMNQIDARFAKIDASIREQIDGLSDIEAKAEAEKAAATGDSGDADAAKPAEKAKADADATKP